MARTCNLVTLCWHRGTPAKPFHTWNAFARWKLWELLRLRLDSIRRQSRVSAPPWSNAPRSEEHTSELQSRLHLVCRLLLEKKKNQHTHFCFGLKYYPRDAPSTSL